MSYERIDIIVFGEQDRTVLEGSPPDMPVSEVLGRSGCLLTRDLDPEIAALPWGEVEAHYLPVSRYGLFPPPAPPAPGGPAASGRPSRRSGDETGVAAPAPPASNPPPRVHRPAPPREHPEALSDREAVVLVYGDVIDDAAAQLRVGNCVLITCEKLVVAHLWEEIASRAELTARNPFYTAAVQATQTAEATLPTAENADQFMAQLEQRNSSTRTRVLSEIREHMRSVGSGEVVVLPHLDLLVGTGANEQVLSREARDVADLLYPTEPSASSERGPRRESAQPLLLAFADPSLTMPEVVTQLFVPLRADGCRRTVVDGGDEIPLSQALVIRRERDAFAIDEQDFYKHVAGMNPVRLRQAMRFAYSRHQYGGGSMDDLRDALRSFKDASSAGFQEPKETWADIGGYEHVKKELRQAIELIEKSQGPKAAEYQGLAPRGFVFHGPPGTGKTLFAKAMAHALAASLMVVSGPEVNSRWYGESEGRIRDLFAQARRNAPSVLVFDEFDAIARVRSEQSDGGSRAGNAVVAQILTEMDGFRPDVIMLVIGTTNRKDDLDPALLRPSRFHAIEIPHPDPEARRKILGYYNGKHKLKIGRAHV